MLKTIHLAVDWHHNKSPLGGRSAVEWLLARRSQLNGFLSLFRAWSRTGVSVQARRRNVRFCIWARSTTNTMLRGGRLWRTAQVACDAPQLANTRSTAYAHRRGQDRSRPGIRLCADPDTRRTAARMARKLDPPNSKFNQGLHLRPKLRDLRFGECPGNSTDQTGDAKTVDTTHSSGSPAVHD